MLHFQSTSTYGLLSLNYPTLFASYTLNFSKPAAPIVVQMFNFLNLGVEGYRQICCKDLRNSRLLSRALEMSGYYKACRSYSPFLLPSYPPSSYPHFCVPTFTKATSNV